MGLQIPRMLVQISDMPLGMCWPTPDEYAKLVAKNLIVTPPQDFSTFVYGAVAPTSDQGPWFNTTLNEWWVWNQTAGKYVAERPSSITGESPIGTIVQWAGTIADIPLWFNGRGAEWRFCKGDAISRTDYDEAFGIMGVQYGIGDGTTTFNIPDFRNYFLVCADSDSGGTAMTNVGDGATLIKSRPFTDHVHGQGNPSVVGAGKTAGNSYTNGALDPASDAVTAIPSRALPPLFSVPFVVRIK